METRYTEAELAKYNAARQDIIQVDKKIDRVYERLEHTNRSLDSIPRKLENMEYGVRNTVDEVENLKRAQQMHGMKLELLEKELEYVKTGNDVLLGRMRHGGDVGGDDRGKDGYGYGDRGGHATDRPGDFRLNTPPGAGPRYEDQAPPRGGGGGGGGLAVRPPSPAREARRDGDERSTLNTAERREKAEEERREKRRQIYSIHDYTAIRPDMWEKKSKLNTKQPWLDQQTTAKPGGLMFLRFDDVAYGEVKIVLRSPIQSICRNAGGYALGIARKERIFVYEDTPSKIPSWNLAREQKYKDVKQVMNAVVVFWFTNQAASDQLFENSHHNRFREPAWPSPNGWDARYLPLNCPLPTKDTYKTIFVVEFINATRLYSSEQMTQFEAEAREAMSREAPGSLPMMVSAQASTHGSFIRPGSKAFVSLFESQREVDRLWQSGLIQRLRSSWGMTGDINAFSMTIEDLL